MKYKIKHLSTDCINLLEKTFQSTTFPTSFRLLHEKLVPEIAMVLIEGEAHICKKKVKLATIRPGSLVGLHELINNEPLPFSCELEPNAKILVLEKSRVLELLEQEHLQTKNYFSLMVKDI